MTTPTTDTPAAEAAALERALLRENLSVALTLEQAHPDAAPDIAEAAARALRFDAGRGGFVDRTSGEPLAVRDWLRQRKADRRHWFREASTTGPAEPTAARKPAGFSPAQDQPTPPGTPAEPTAAPVGRRYQRMSEHEYAAYRRQNRYARVLAAANVGGQRVFTVDCGAAASPGQVGAQSMDEYRRWRESQGLGRPAGGR